ncbi:hypothetical protein JQ581_32055 [Bradyrhizobium liaoningense]|uniref:DUF6894 family protein n=1 Tax=Bradyrhizobium liaoningense TaxID=43992 RepID=UPI001BA91D13|nr:hypothetical protein [Bradyrhizobium liaoningense]MBR0741577.1 hypothetical protein [Bradyrhizobium liaoningense]
MPHFYFDIWDGESLVVDEEGLSLTGQRAAEVEAALSLADITRELDPFTSSDGLTIQVRDAVGPVFSATFVGERALPGD